MDSPIRTKTYVPDREVIFRYFYLRNFAKRLAIVLVLYLVIVGIYAVLRGVEQALGIFGILMLIFGVFVVLGYTAMRRNLSSPAMKIALDVPRYLEFTDHDLYGKMEDGGESRVPWDHYSHAVRKGQETFLYRVGGVVNVPDSAFESPDDLTTFQALLKQKGMFERKKSGARR